MSDCFANLNLTRFSPNHLTSTFQHISIWIGTILSFDKVHHIERLDGFRNAFEF